MADGQVTPVASSRSSSPAPSDDDDDDDDVSGSESQHVTTASDQVSIKYDDESGNEVCTQPAALAHA